MGHKHTILSTAVLPEAQMLQLEQAGILCEQIPFISIQQSVSAEVRSAIDRASRQQKAVVFTSVNAVAPVVAALAGKIPDWQVFCISGATRMAVEQYFGADKVAGSADDAASLEQKISVPGPAAEVLFFCGNKRMDTLPGLLSGRGIRVEEYQVYTTTLSPVRLDKSYDAILFFSPSGVESYLSENEMAQDTVLFTIGHTTAKAVKSSLPNKVIVSPEPGKKQLTETVIAYYKA
ncbi:MAG: uroporphyrinogen-III synthase [Chitinophagaceae bacterium]|nr:uroporphyrinogen-III synthase [Chitinophagaceae bacterium]